MNKTANYQLNRWEKTDKVLMDDFNADNEKIDAAIAKCGNCRVRVSTYVGDGALTRTHTFDRKPIMMLVLGSSVYLIMVPGYESLSSIEGTSRPIDYVWTDHSVTVSGPYSSAYIYCNQKDLVYTMITFEDAGVD